MRSFICDGTGKERTDGYTNGGKDVGRLLRQHLKLVIVGQSIIGEKD